MKRMLELRNVGLNFNPKKPSEGGDKVDHAAFKLLVGDNSRKD